MTLTALDLCTALDIYPPAALSILERFGRLETLSLRSRSEESKGLTLEHLAPLSAVLRVLRIEDSLPFTFSASDLAAFLRTHIRLRILSLNPSPGSGVPSVSLPGLHCLDVILGQPGCVLEHFGALLDLDASTLPSRHETLASYDLQTLDLGMSKPSEDIGKASAYVRGCFPNAQVSAVSAAVRAAL